MGALRRNLPVLAAALVALAVTVAIYRFRHGPATRRVIVSVAEVQAVHASVTAAGRAVSGVTRVSAGDVVETGEDGRARLRLDDGASAVLDRGTSLIARGAALDVSRGRVFVKGASDAHTRVSAAGVTAVVADAALAIEITKDGATFFCASGEVSLQKDGDRRLRSGETAKIAGGALTIAPEKAFRDFTFGMATPWSATGKPRSAIGQLWGRLSDVSDDGGTPLAIRSHEVDVRIDGELARTRVRTTFFHGGDRPVVGDFRMAVPPGALVAKFELEGETKRESRIAVARDDGPEMPRLEWAGEGWLRGNTGPLSAGATLTTVVEYVEWLSPSGDRLTYRYPMLGDGKSIPLGELRVHVDAAGADPIGIHAPEGARVTGTMVDITRADVRPTSDLTIELDLPPGRLGAARAYVAKPKGTDDGGAYVMVRTEAPALPPEAGVTLALVIDSSLSIEPALLDAERALVEALLEGLGARDRVVVWAADQTARPVGPADLGLLTPERRQAIAGGLSRLRPGGATDLGAALERAADSLPPDAPAALVVYVGDGWPDLGDATVDAVRARLGRRSGGAPRLGAVAVGPLANRFALTALVRGGGPVLEIAAKENAAEVAVHLLAEALTPAVAGVEVDLGPNVERVYPRGPRAVTAGGTVVTVGRARSLLPTEMKLRYRRGMDVVEDVRSLATPIASDDDDVRRRWGAARVEELALRGEGRESAVDVALAVGLLTPWTALTFGSNYKPSPLDSRVLDLSATAGAPLSARFVTPSAPIGTLVGPSPEELLAKEDENELRRAVTAAAQRTMQDALAQIRACRDSRAALRPELSGELHVRVRLEGDGRVSNVAVKGLRPSDDDAALDRCVETVVRSLTFEGGSLRANLQIDYDFHLPPPRDPRAKRCSPASTVALPLRRGIWKQRLERTQPAATYLQARAACELSSWSDRRALLELLLGRVEDGVERVAVARVLDEAGESDAAEVLRREAVRRASTPRELWQVRLALLGDERKPSGVFRKRYDGARTDAERLAVVQTFLRLSPHDGTLRRQELALLFATDKKDELRSEILRARQDPFADAALLADGASLLRRLGDDAEARRAFGELVERAPSDPFARAYLGDRLRAEGLFDDAIAAYEALSTLLPEDASVTLRMALAHAGAGRLDLASRLLSRVAETGGRQSDQSLGDLAALTGAVLLEDARAGSGPDVLARLSRRELELPLGDGEANVLVRAPFLDAPVQATLRRDGPSSPVPPDVAAPSLGLVALRVGRGEGKTHLLLRRAVALSPAASVRVRVDVIGRDEQGTPRRVLSREIDVPANAKEVDLVL